MRRVFAAVGTATIGTLTALTGIVLSPVGASAGQYWETSTSGAGTTTGTATSVSSWVNWSVPESQSNPCTPGPIWCDGTPANGEGFTAESVWLIHLDSNGNPTTDALEVGFGSGYAIGQNGGWTNAMQPYYTLNDGGTEVNATSGYDLPANTQIWIQAIADGTSNGSGALLSWASNQWAPVINNYAVTYRRQNFVQYETEYGDDWMGGGSPPSLMHMYYQPQSSYPSGWNNWGGMTCGSADHSPTGAPFDYSRVCNASGTAYLWEGYGYGNNERGS
jgi:hypothetical protein